MKFSATPISRRAGRFLILAALLLSAPASVAADVDSYVSATEAYRQGIAAQARGDAGEALKAFEFAANRGVLGAKLKLARMHAQGEGVPQSHAQAYYYYESVADEYAEISPSHPFASQVAEAFVAVGIYYRDGISELRVAPDPARSTGFFRHAATILGDPAAQYHLARLYLDGHGVAPNVRLAVNWLASAAKKHYAPAQAVLGDLLWRGHPDVEKEQPKGLALLALARLNAQKSGIDAAWIEDLYEQAVSEAEPGQRDTATALAARWGGPSGPGAPTIDAAKPDDPSATAQGEPSR